MKKRILHLTLKKKWFDLIASGRKKIEYREAKPYWMTRLEGRKFDEIYFRNGYSKNSPFMRVEYKGIYKVILDAKIHYAIHLGKIEEVKNYETNKI